MCRSTGDYSYSSELSAAIPQDTLNPPNHVIGWDFWGIGAVPS